MAIALHPFVIGTPPLKGTPLQLRGDTIKFWVSDGTFTCQALGFGMKNSYDAVCQAKEIDLVYTPSIDRWQEEPSIQLEVKDIKVD